MNAKSSQPGLSWHPVLLAAVLSVTIVLFASLWRLATVRAAAAAEPTPTPQATALPTATPTPNPAHIWLDHRTPAEIALPVAQWIADHSETFSFAPDRQRSGTAFVSGRDGAGFLLHEELFVVAVPFENQGQSMTWADLQDAWTGRTGPSRRWLVEQRSADQIMSLLGPAGPDTLVQAGPVSALVDQAWAEGDSYVLLPFDQLDPRLAPLTIDGIDPLDPLADMSNYPLAHRLWIEGPDEMVRNLLNLVPHSSGPTTNRDPAGLGTLAVTGITSLTRGAALAMDARNDATYLAREIAPFLATADITHVSLEAPFVQACEPQEVMARYCARLESVKALQVLGADVVELSNGHILDFGQEGLATTLQTLQEAGLHSYGVGPSQVEAGNPLVFEVKGTRVALLAYNQSGPPESWAGEGQAGTARFHIPSIAAGIAQARQQADVVMVHVQHSEPYATLPTPRQELDFAAIADADADVVVGTHAHQPQSALWRDGSLILHGLGNLIADQDWSLETRRSVVAWHVFYQGRLISTRLMPTEINGDSQPQWLPPDRARVVLDTVLPSAMDQVR
jgi:poly-gamma-glutamate synthesis protein (capsule biosynthesis protein)